MKLLIPALTMTLLTACGDNPFNDYTEIKDTDYAAIRIEIDRCNHVAKEGSFSASMRFSPRMACLNHLKKRIIHTGNASKELIEGL